MVRTFLAPLVFATSMLASSAQADSWTHTFSRGFDLFLTGTDRAGLRIACDSDQERRGSVFAVRMDEMLSVGTHTYILSLGSYSLSVVATRELIVLLDRMTPKDRQALAAAFSTAGELSVVRDGEELLNIALGTDRPDLCS